MWLLINVDDIADVGKNENKRYSLSDNLSIANGRDFDIAVIAGGTEVRPATKDVIDEIWDDDDDIL